MNDGEIEEILKAKKLTAPRIDKKHIDSMIEAAEEQYYVFPGTTTTVCCLKLQSTFTLVGQSAYVSQTNFNAEIGQKLAKADAIRKLWPLEGYLLAVVINECGEEICDND